MRVSHYDSVRVWRCEGVRVCGCTIERVGEGVCGCVRVWRCEGVRVCGCTIERVCEGV